MQDGREGQAFTGRLAEACTRKPRTARLALLCLQAPPSPPLLAPQGTWYPLRDLRASPACRDARPPTAKMAPARANTREASTASLGGEESEVMVAGAHTTAVSTQWGSWGSRHRNQQWRNARHRAFCHASLCCHCGDLQAGADGAYRQDRLWPALGQRLIHRTSAELTTGRRSPNVYSLSWSVPARANPAPTRCPVGVPHKPTGRAAPAVAPMRACQPGHWIAAPMMREATLEAGRVCVCERRPS